MSQLYSSRSCGREALHFALLRASGQDAECDVGAIRDDAVYPEIEETVHSRSVVDGPDVHLDLSGVQEPNHPFCHYLYTEILLGNLYSVDRIEYPAQQGSGTQLSDNKRTRKQTRRRGCCDAGQLAHGRTPPLFAKRGDQHAINGLRLEDRGDRGRHGVGALDVDVKTRLGERIECLRERAERLIVTEINLLQSGETEGVDASLDTRHARKVGVVADDRDPVARRVHVGFDVRYADADRGDKCQECVLGGLECEAPMREHPRGSGSEEGRDGSYFRLTEWAAWWAPRAHDSR